MSSDVIILENDLNGRPSSIRMYAGWLRDRGYTRDVVAALLRSKGCIVTLTRFHDLPALFVHEYPGDTYKGEVRDLIVWLTPGNRVKFDA